MVYARLKRILALSFFVLLIEGTLSAQQNLLSQKVSVRFRNVTVDSALKILQNNIPLNFTYNSNLVPKGKKIRATFDSIPLAIVLDSLLQRPLLQYHIIDNQLILYEKTDSIPISSLKIQPAKTITGKIIDRSNRSVLSYSTIGILHRNIGVISNQDGIFVFKIPAKFSHDTLVISHLGYFLYKIPVAELKDYDTYKMDERTVSLPEILIRSISAPELVRRAILRIPENYFRGPYIMRSFYREIVKRDKKYLSYTEAILDTYKRPMRPTLFHDEVKVTKERKYTNVKYQDTLVFKLKGGIDAILRLDIIRNPLEFIELDNSKCQFSLINMDFLDGRLAYVIHFTPKENVEDPAFEGEMYIDAKTFAILQIHFGYSKKSLKQITRLLVVKSSRGIKSYPTENSYQVSYQYINGKYYINHIIGKIGLKVKKKKQWLASHYSVCFEMISTDIENKNPIRFQASETIRPNRIFSDMIPGAETTFWENENIIPPEVDITKAIKKFKTEDLEMKK